MRDSQVAFWLSLVFCGAGLTVGFALVGRYTLGAAAVILLGGWWMLERRRVLWGSSASLAIVLGIAAYGGSNGAEALLMLLAALGALAAWDLARFRHRLAPQVQDILATDIERSHLVRLGWVLGLGSGLGALAVTLDVRFRFGLALILAALGLLGLLRISAGLLPPSGRPPG